MKPSIKTKVDAANFKEWLATTSSCCNVIFFSLDLRGNDEELVKLTQAKSVKEGAVFLGCKIGPLLTLLLAQHHGLIFPDIKGKPYHIYREGLYTTEEFFSGYDSNIPGSYKKTAHWHIHLHKEEEDKHQVLINSSLVKMGTEEILARALHDHFIQEQLYCYLDSLNHSMYRGVVAILGGHRVLRSSLVYSQIATISRQLSREGYLIVSGGGEGLMEAANLGAWFAPLPDEEMNCAIAMLSIDGADSFDDPLWFSTAWNIQKATRCNDSSKQRSLSISAWRYSNHNVFTTDIAKFFSYSRRETALLSLAKQGFIYAEGSAGTIQEIFQTAFYNHDTDQTNKHSAPMICFGEAYWNPPIDQNGNYPKNTKPVWSLLQKLAQDTHFEHCIKKTSDPEVAINFIKNFKHR